MKKRFIIFYVATFCIVAGLSFALPASSAILFYEDFEDALDFAGNTWHREHSGNGGSRELTTEQVRSGLKSCKFSLTKYVEADYREQITLRAPWNHDGTLNFTKGHEYWIAFSILIADGFYTPTEPGTWGPIIQEYHASPDACDTGIRNPILSFQPKNGNWLCWDQYTSWPCNPAPKEGVHGFMYNYGAFSTGQWYDFVINIKWSYESDGFIKIWQNGVLVTDRNGPNCFNDAIGPYFMLGIYGSINYGQTVTFYFDEVRIGDSNSSYSEVAPGGSVVKKLLPPPSVQVTSK